MSWRAFRIAEHRTTLDHEQLEAQLGHRTRWQASGTCSAREACARGPVPDQTVSDQERASYPPTLPGAAPTWTQCSVSSLSITNYNTHRPHRSLHQRPPTDNAPPLSTATIRPLRRDRLGGLICEYVLSHGMTGFSAPTGERGGNVLGDHPRQLGRCSPVDAPRVAPIENTGRTTGAGYGCTTPGTPADCQRRNRRHPP